MILIIPQIYLKIFLFNDLERYTESLTQFVYLILDYFPYSYDKSLFIFLSFWLTFGNRLRCLVKQLEKGDVNIVDLKKNIEYAASVLEAVYIDETR